MPDHLLNLVENRVNWIRSDESDVMTIDDFDASLVKRIIAGLGLFYFYDEGWNSELSFLQNSPVNLTSGWRQITLMFDMLWRFPCTGIVTNSTEGYLIAPAAKIEVVDGSNIALMLLSPRTMPHHVSMGKPALAIPGEANVKISVEGPELHCIGTISGSNFDTTRVIMNRNPHLPEYREGYNEELCRLTAPGEINLTWKPVARIFEECLLVFYPSTVGGDDLGDVAHRLGVPDDDSSNVSNATVIGDGLFTDYKLRLVIDRRFRRNRSDETAVTVK